VTGMIASRNTLKSCIIHIALDAKLWHVLFAIVMMGTTTVAQHPWNFVNPNYGDRDVYAVAFANPDLGVAVGTSTVLRTTDGGERWSWTATNLEISDTLLAVAFATTDRVFAVGSGGLLIKSLDGGLTWESVPTGQSGRFSGVSFWSPDSGIIVGLGTATLVTTDGGISWTPHVTDLQLRAVSWASPGRVWAVGSGGWTYTGSTPGTWVEKRLSTTANMLGVYATSDETSISVGLVGSIFKTVNGGGTWTKKTTGTSESLLSVSFSKVDSGFGWVVGTLGTILRTNNGGESWSTQPSGTTSTLRGVFAVTKDLAFAVGSGGLFLRTVNGGGSWETLSHMVSTTTTFRGLRFVGADYGWVVGSGGRIYRTTDGGAMWSEQSSGADRIYYGIDAWSKERAVAVGSNGKIEYTVNGGITWSPAESGKTGILTSVSFGSSDRVYAVGAAGSFIRSDDAGSTWSTLSSGTSSTIDGVFALNRDTVFVVAGGQIRRTMNGGQTFVGFASGTSRLYAIHFPTPSTGYVVGHLGAVLKTTNGGTSWSLLASGTSTTLYNVRFSSADSGLAVGAGGLVLRTNDGGTIWTQESTGTVSPLYGLDVFPSTSGMISGEGQVILRKETPALPQVPTNVRLELSGQSLAVGWKPLRQDLPALTGYTASLSPGGATCTAGPSDSTCLISAGLSNGQTYSIIVTAANALGTSASAPSANLTFLIPPGMPTAVSAWNGNNQILVEWAEPVFNGAPVTHYIVHSNSSLTDSLITCYSVTTACIFPTQTGSGNLLPNGVAFRFLVTAFNETVSGPVSALSNPATGFGEPAAPTTITAVPGNSQVTVSWTPPADNGGRTITSYKVLASEDKTKSCETILGSPSVCTVVGLTNEVTYTFLVQANNSVGMGLPSAVSAPVTPRNPPNIAYPTAPLLRVDEDMAPLNPNVTGTVEAWSIVPALPTGLTFDTITGVISGTTSEPFESTSFAITARNVGGSDTAIIALSAYVPIQPPTLLLYDQVNALYSQGAGITMNKPKVIGGNDSLVYELVDGSLPSGVFFNPANGNIYGVPEETGSFNPVLRVANSSGSAEVTLNLVVREPQPIIAFAVDTVEYDLGRPIAEIVPERSGGVVREWSISPDLHGHTGLIFNPTTGRISGTPTRLSEFVRYNVTATGFDGLSDMALVTIGVATPVPSISFSVDTVNWIAGQTVEPLRKSGASGVITHYSVMPPMPDGLVFNPTTGAVTGRPMAAWPPRIFEITAHGPGGEGRDTVVISANWIPLSLTYAVDTLAVAVGSSVSVSKSGVTGLVTHYSIEPELPAGLVFNRTTGRILGTPIAVTNAVAYVITAHGPGGAGSDTLVMSCTTPVPTISYTLDTLTLDVNQPVSIMKSGVSGLVSHYSIDPSLPNGLRFNPTSGSITGVPTSVWSYASFVISVHGPGGVGSDTIVMRASTAAPTLSYAFDSVTFDVGVPLTITKNGVSGLVSHYSIVPPLPNGLRFNVTSGAINGVATSVWSYGPYVITVHGPGGEASDTIVIGSTTVAPTVTYAFDTLALTVGLAVDVSKSGISGRVTHYSIAPPLPSGLTFNSTTGRILGTPVAVSSPAGYIVWVHGPGGTGTTSLVLGVTTPAPTVTYDVDTVRGLVGVTIDPVSKSGATGMISHYSIEPPLSPGLIFNTTSGRISGAATRSSQATIYTITAHGPGGTGGDDVVVVVDANPPVLSFASASYSFVTGTVVDPFRPDNTGGRITSWVLSSGSNGKSLTANTGLQFNPTTGRIFGTPTIGSSAVEYTVTAHGLDGSSGQTALTLSTHFLAKLAAGESEAFSVRVTGASKGYIFRIPLTDETFGRIIVTISDLSGRTVWAQSVDPRMFGREMTWDGRDQRGRLVSGGLYLVSVTRHGGGRATMAKGKLVTGVN
jgi:photosystem II stability/assembly factor-like uncharacterized protein